MKRKGYSTIKKAAYKATLGLICLLDMNNAKNWQEPQDNCDHHDDVENGFNKAIHRNKSVDQPQQNAHNNECEYGGQ